MAQIIGILIAAAVAVFALKLALLMVFLIGIIFRTKATLGLIAMLGVLALLRNYPVICYTLTGVVIVVALTKGKDDDPPRLTDS